MSKNYNIVLNHTYSTVDNDEGIAADNRIIATFYDEEPDDFIVDVLWDKIRDEILDNSPEGAEFREENHSLAFKCENAFDCSDYSLRVIEIIENDEDWKE